jgi:hypothetical protein
LVVGRAGFIKVCRIRELGVNAAFHQPTGNFSSLLRNRPLLSGLACHDLIGITGIVTQELTWARKLRLKRRAVVVVVGNRPVQGDLSNLSHPFTALCGRLASNHVGESFYVVVRKTTVWARNSRNLSLRFLRSHSGKILRGNGRSVVFGSRSDALHIGELMPATDVFNAHRSATATNCIVKHLIHNSIEFLLAAPGGYPT